MQRELSRNTRLIRQLNDEFRTTLQGGRVMLTRGILSFSEKTLDEIIRRTTSFTDFDDANDPHQEHDFIAFELAGAHIFVKIDYYAPNLQHGSDDPADPAKTARVMTIMMAEEY